jgi:two-component system CheB/CheR fusion protein
MEAVFAAISAPIMVFDPAARVTRANAAACLLLGFDPAGLDCETIIARLNVRNLDGTPVKPEALPSHRALSGDSVAGRFAAITESGERFIFHAVAAPLRVHGQVTGAVVVWRDVTDRERLIEELAASNSALAEADRRKDEFLAMLGHELRNPLGAISNAARLIRLRASRGMDVERALEVLERQIDNSSRLIDDLLDVSRITRGAIHLKRELVRLEVVVANAVEAQRFAIDAARHQLSVTLPEEPLYTEGDPTRLEQIVSNLVNNAAKYTAEGGRIAVALERAGDRVEIRVRDTGVGIPPDLLPRIFDLFVQGDTSLARSKSGLGLGLTVVRRLVEMQGGTVAARSDGPGKGSEFVVSLPVASPAWPGPPARPELGIGSGARILVVEDNADAAETLAEWLRMLGYHVTVAHDGDGALREAATTSPDIVLLDIGLPGMDGYEVGRRLQSVLPAPPVIVGLTGYGQDEDRERSREAGFAFHLTKPVAPQALDTVLALLRPGEADGAPPPSG